MVKKLLRGLSQFLTGQEAEKEMPANPENIAKKSVASDLSGDNINQQVIGKPSPKLSDPEAAHSSESMNLRSFGITDVGLKRSHNEDNFFRSDELGIYLVADGMGGHAAGEVASSSTVKTVSEFVEKFSQDSSLTWPFGFDTRLNEEGNALITGIQLANHTLCKMQQRKPELNGMGTTLASLRITGDQALIAHVGDSRVYRWRNKELELLTSDHSWVNEQLQKNIITPDEARTHRYRNVITRALGNRTELEIDVRLEKIEPGDCFMLCSDGLSGMIEDDEMQAIMAETPDCVRSMSNKLVSKANEAGGHDNISVVIVCCD